MKEEGKIKQESNEGKSDPKAQEKPKEKPKKQETGFGGFKAGFLDAKPPKKA